MLQSREPLSPAGSGSVRVAFSAAPGPAFHTTMVKLATSPPWIAGLAAVLAMFRPGHSTVTSSEGLSVGLFVAATVATLVYVAQSSGVVLLTTWTDTPVPASRSPNEHTRVCAPALP